VLFADEPTGNLDAASGALVIGLLESLNRESGSTVVLVTHDLSLAARASRIIRLGDGRLVSDSAPNGLAAPPQSVPPTTA
jgi:predicted ABC-type transport system involved in lysophospholipase L1 biosynthesis ATPase subunit